MFAQLLQQSFIEKKGDVWSLTDQGVKAGGKFVISKQYGKYITWPEDLKLKDVGNESLITATAIGKHFNLSANKINYILSEIGWAQKALKGWRATIQEKKQGGLQDGEYTFSVAVDDDYKGQRIGKSLFQLVKKEILSLGAKRIIIQAKVPAYWSKFGFTEVIDLGDVPKKFRCDGCSKYGKDCFPKIMILDL